MKISRILLTSSVLSLVSSLPAHATPSRQWGTYYGGSDLENGSDVDFNSGLDVDVVGVTASSSGIATVGTHDAQWSGNSDGFLAQIDQSGARVWGTYYGGGGSDFFSRLDHNDDDEIYAAGSTNSTGSIASPGAHQTSLGGGFDAMLVKFDASGDRLWGTYFGGDDDDWGWGTCVSGAGDVYIVGSTTSTDDIATTGDTALSSDEDGFIAKFSHTGVLAWASYIGGDDGLTQALNCAVDSSGNVYVTGLTLAINGIATAGHDTVLNNEDAFLLKFSSGGTRLWGSYYGGSSNDVGLAVAVDAADNVYLGGSTSSSSGMVTFVAHDITLSDQKDAFVAKFNASGTRQWGTYFGSDNAIAGLSEEYFDDMEIYGGQIFLSGQTDAWSGITTTGAWDSSNTGGNSVGMFVVMTTGGVLNFSSYAGQSMDTGTFTGVSVAQSGAGRAAMSSHTTASTGLATSGTHDTTYNGQGDAAIMYVHLWDV